MNLIARIFAPRPAGCPPAASGRTYLRSRAGANFSVSDPLPGEGERMPPSPNCAAGADTPPQVPGAGGDFVEPGPADIDPNVND